MILILAVAGLGLGPAAAWLPEMFAARYRYTAAGLAYSLAAILGGAVPPIIATPLQASYGGIAIGLLLAGFGVLGVVCGLALPETKHRTLDVVTRTTSDVDRGIKVTVRG